MTLEVVGVKWLNGAKILKKCFGALILDVFENVFRESARTFFLRTEGKGWTDRLVMAR